MRSIGSVVSAAVAVLALNGCASSGAVKAAERGDLPTLKKQLADGLKSGSLSTGESRSVAQALASREVKQAKGEEGVVRIDDVLGCVRELEGTLDDKAREKDATAARAAFALVDAHLEGSRWVDKVNSDDASWRAVGARSLVDQSGATKRRELFVDLDTQVRRAALSAALDAPFVEDAPVLLETVRLDPDRLSRTLAARAVGAIGGRTVVLALKDRWAAADEPLRATFASAWASPASAKEGGLDQLLWAAESEQGVPSLTASATLLRFGGKEANIGAAALARAIENGSTNTRTIAIAFANLDRPEHREAVKKAAEDADQGVKVAALGKLGILKDERAHALEELGVIAASDSPHRNAARTAMAQLRDRRVVALLAADLSSSKPGVRMWAAQTLAGMHELPQAAQALADDDVAVRTRVACSILSSPRQ
ncbi:MAG: hypothetical protein U0165_20860 [Polyangiaceae bacterium]